METIQTILRDVRFALRLLAKNPGFTIVAVLTLALGIGANTAAFSWIQNVILRSLPGVREPDRLVVVAPRHASGSIIDTMSYADIRDLNQRKDIFEGVIGSQMSLCSLNSGDDAKWIWGQVVSSGYFELLGVRPQLGRFFSPEETEKPRAFPVMILSHNFWQKQFASDREVVGKTVTVNQHPFTVIGVAPAGFQGTMGGLSFDFWAPITVGEFLGREEDGNPALYENRGARWLHSICRLAPGVNIKQAQAAVGTISRAWEKEFPNSHREQTLTLFPLWNAPWGAPKVMLPILTILFAVTALVLLIVAANFANLLLARAAVRVREISVRMALGGSRRRVMRQLLTESLTLAGLGSALGIPCAIWMTDALARMFPKMYLPIEFNAKVDLHGLAFMTGVALAIGILFGLAPAWHAARADLFAGLKEGSRGNSSPRTWLRNGLIIAQVALAVLLVIGGALCFQSFQHARAMSRGFDPNGVVLANIRLFSDKYDKQTGNLFYQRLIQKIREIPGVQNVALANYVPLGPEGGGSSRIVVEGYSPQPGESMQVPLNIVTPGYFDVVKIPILDGRDFRESDDVNSMRAIVVNETFARRFWPQQNPIGRRVTIFGDQLMTVVGVAGDTKIRNLNEPSLPFFFIPLRQYYSQNMNIHARVAGNPVAFNTAIAEAARSIDPAVNPAIAGALTEVTDFAMLPFRISATLLTALAGVAVFLAVMGLYGLIAFSVAQRTVEIGIRMALGARAADVLAMVLGQGFRLAAIGVVAGVIGAFALTRLMRGVLVGVNSADPLTFSAAAIFFILTALLASYVPARRAASVNPLVALKYE
jgi:predicted permease